MVFSSNFSLEWEYWTHIEKVGMMELQLSSLLLEEFGNCHKVFHK